MPEIRILPPNLINKIAAGEVIERPASVVKELLENSIDAGARRIEVTIDQGGLELIRISDDGCGMSPAQLPLAIASHATSKLPEEETLFRVQTLGFRGEALASIGSVSHLRIRSRTSASESGAEIEVRGGQLEGPVPCGCPVGTVMEIRNLFYNTPVRRKFLRTPQTEMGHIVEAFTRLALAYPAVQMTLQSGGRILSDVPPTTHWADRVGAFFGGEVGESLIPVQSDDGQVRIEGYVCDPAVNRGHSRMQYLFLNGRHIRDRALQHALTEAYRGLLMTGRHPVCFLRLEMPPELVDVNVHPTKLEVRFADSSRIYARILQTLRHQFLTTDLTMRVGPPAASTPADTTAHFPATAGSQLAASRQSAGDLGQPFDDAASQLGMSPAIERAQRQSVIQWARGEGRTPEFRPFGDPTSPRPLETPTSAHATSSTPILVPPGPPAPDANAPFMNPAIDDSLASAATSGLRSDAPHPALPAAHSHAGYQIHDRYLVTQDQRGMVVVDQHALHERILYERIREKVLGGALETQRLLVPEPVSLLPSEHAVALESQSLLAKVGIEIEAFGGDSLLIRSYPAMLANLKPAEMLRQALESLIAAGKDPEVRDLLDHLLHTIACKAAIKAGDRLTAEEITSLLEQRELYHDTHHCPHGRPTALFFSREELDRMFGRLGPRSRRSVET